MLATLLALFVHASLDSNQVAEPGFESGGSGWSSWARATDSLVTAVVADGACVQGTHCLSIAHRGSQDWGVWPSEATLEVAPGEIWEWALSVRVDSLTGSAELGFVTRDSSDAVLDWNAAAVSLGAGTGWTRITARLSVPGGCASLQPRLTGYGHGGLRIDSGDFRRVATASTSAGDVSVQSDSVRLRVGGDLALSLVDRVSGDSTVFAGVPGLHLDSSRAAGDTTRLFLRQLADLSPVVLSAWASGGSAFLRLEADSATPMPDEIEFPGRASTRAGQELLLPRGTGLAIPVDGPLPSAWVLQGCAFADWQVSQGIAGAVGGVLGFLLDFDEPWDARQAFAAGTSGRLEPSFFQRPARGVWGHARTLVLSPLREGGFAEPARRHRARLQALGRVRDWTAKTAADPDVAKLRGAVDLWMEGAWTGLPGFVDTLRLLGLEKALVNWRQGGAADVDSLAARGWLVSTYDDYSDAFPPGHEGLQSLGYADGVVVQEDGSFLEGWLLPLSDGDSLQALEICPARHAAVAREVVASDEATGRNARFVDVELAMSQVECWSKEHGLDRSGDARGRLAALALVKDTLGFVTGSEQHRDWATSVVDWGEGPMSLASVADAGYDWNTPEAPEAYMDTLSMAPARRVPLLPLATHDAFAPTWYTGDGQSKVPARWDRKDAWNALYATMPLLQPRDRAMWDSLESRYLRTANLLGPWLERTGFVAMTGFERLSDDRAVQRTAFAGGWTATANLGGSDAAADGAVLPPDGFLATDGTERIERGYLDGAVRSRARLSDRWFLDPEGSEAVLDGIRTGGALLLARTADTVVRVSFVGGQSRVAFEPSALPWPATRLAARVLGGGAVALADSSGWSVLTRSGTKRFYELTGDFGALTASVARGAGVAPPRLVRSGSAWICRWTQAEAGTVRLSLATVDGRIRSRRTLRVGSGVQEVRLEAPRGAVWLEVESDGTRRTARAVGF